MNKGAAFSNKKKVRSWKTQMRRVERWRAGHLTPDRAQVERLGYDVCKIQVDPWNRLTRREPPLWLGRSMIHGLLDIHASWTEAMPEAGYLKIWLNWPHLMDSQVVMAGATRLAWYEGMFRPADDLGQAGAKGFPPQFGPALLERLRGWEWQECLAEFDVDPADLPAGWLERRSHRHVTLGNGRSQTLVLQGRVWIGTRRAPE